MNVLDAFAGLMASSKSESDKTGTDLRKGAQREGAAS